MAMALKESKLGSKVQCGQLPPPTLRWRLRGGGLVEMCDEEGEKDP